MSRLPHRRSAAQQQSAMEYLMTYGWAILIIAVVLGALYSLGVFNTASLQPKVPGGGCHVFRPNGPGTSWNVNLVGSCNNALPQYVAQFNGQSSYVSVPTMPVLNPANSATFSFWYYPAILNDGQNRIIIEKGLASGLSQYYIRQQSGSFNCMFNNGARTYDTGWVSYSSLGINTKAWYYITCSVNDTGTTLYVYVDGAQKNTALGSTAARAQNTNSLQLGFMVGYNYFSGFIANVQIYNTTLTANQVKYLYNEGIGGVPISPQYLVGWWPLNGDTLDYSGNGNDGAQTNVAYNGSWTSGYYR